MKDISAELFGKGTKSSAFRLRQKLRFCAKLEQKGISAIIATIMLLMISVSMVGVFYAFSSGTVSTSTSSASEQTSQLTKQLTSCMRIDNINNNQVTLKNCGKGVIENKSLVVMMDDVNLGASTTTITEGNSSVVNVTGLWQIAPGKHTLKISNGAAVAQNLVDVQPNKDGLVGSWNFDEGSGITSKDSSGYNNHGTYKGSSLQFDGSNDYVNVGNSNSILNLLGGHIDGSRCVVSGANPITLEFWVKKNSSGSWGIVAGRWRNWLGWYVLINSDGTLAIRGASWGSNGLSSSVANVSADTWHHVAVEIQFYQGEYAKFYVDGVLADTISFHPICEAEVSVPFTIGDTSQSPYIPFNGKLDEVRIYNRSLNATEILQHYQGIYNNETGLVGLWRMKEGNGQAVADDSGMGNAGTLGSTAGSDSNDPTWSTDTVPFWTAGRFNNGPNFNGADKYVKIPDSSVLNPTEITVGAWINSKSFGGYDGIITKYDRSGGKSDGSFYLQVWENAPYGKICFRVDNTSSDYNSYYYQSTCLVSPLSENQWYYVAGAYNSVNLRLYINGVEMANCEPAGLGNCFESSNGTLVPRGTIRGPINPNNGSVHIGVDHPDYMNIFNGSIDEVRIWNKSYTPDDTVAMKQLI